jgi:hypothetical protein
VTLNSHGYHIPNTPDSDESSHPNRHRCGGPRICRTCQAENAAHQPSPNDTSVRSFLRRDGVVIGTQLTRENIEEMARLTGGVLQSEAKSSDPTDVAYWLVIPTLVAPLRVNIGDYLLKEQHTGRWSSMEAQQFQQTYFDRSDPQVVSAIKNGPRLGNSESSYPNPVQVTDQYERTADQPTGRNLFEARQRYTSKEQ